MTKILFLVVLLSSSLSFAQDWYEKGNGGFVLKCPSQPLRVLDLQELESRYKSEMTLDEQNLSSLKGRIEYLISKLEKLNPQRAQKYRSWYSVYDQETEYVANTEFDVIGDLGMVRIPAGCKLSQIAFRREPSILNKARYTVSKDLWDQLGIIDKAALVMHELIYREFSASPNRHQTSEPSRYFNALVNSKELQTMTVDQYLKVLKKLRVTSVGYSSLDASWTPQWQNLKAYWTMNGPVGPLGAGDTLPDYLSRSDAKSSGEGLSFSNKDGISGVTFDGLNYFSVPQTSPANVCKELTWMTWVRSLPSKGSKFASLINTWSGCGPDPAWAVAQNNKSRHIQASFNTTEGFNQWMATSSIPLDGNWHHIALTLTPEGAAVLYVDGIRDATLNVKMGAGICSPTAPMQIGGNQCGDVMGKNGLLSEMAIWDKALTAKEISTVFDRQKASF